MFRNSAMSDYEGAFPSKFKCSIATGGMESFVMGKVGMRYYDVVDEELAAETVLSSPEKLR